MSAKLGKTAADPHAEASPPARIPLSARRGVLWPAVPAGPDAVVLALQAQLDASQWWPAEAVRALQLRQLEVLLAHAARTVPFYGPRLAPLKGLRRGELTLDHVRRLPILGRAELQEAGDALASRRVPKDHGRTFEIRTAGSTGQPVTVKGTAVTALFFRTLNLRYHIWHRRNFAGRVAAVRSLMTDEAAEAARKGKPRAWVQGYASGPSYTFDITRPVGEQLAWVRKIDPDYLMTFPSNLAALLRRAEAEGVELPRLKQVMTMSEVVDPAVRDACERVWGVRLVDIYSCQEAGVVAIQCPDHRHYHVQAENLLVEVLDEDGRPCRPGGVGRVVLTDLHNFATPLIRYELGDHAEVGPPCPCGRGLPVLNRVLGRSRNMLTLPSGDQIWPIGYFSESMMPIAPVRQIQLVQRSLETIEVKLVVARTLRPEEEAELRRYIVGCLGHPLALDFRYVDAIPRSASGKYEDFISLVDADSVGAGPR